MQQILQLVLRSSHPGNNGTATVSPNDASVGFVHTNVLSVLGQSPSRQFSIGSTTPAHAVNLLASQIPEYGSTDSKNGFDYGCRESTKSLKSIALQMTSFFLPHQAD